MKFICMPRGVNFTLVSTPGEEVTYHLHFPTPHILMPLIQNTPCNGKPPSLIPVENDNTMLLGLRLLIYSDELISCLDSEGCLASDHWRVAIQDKTLLGQN